MFSEDLESRRGIQSQLGVLVIGWIVLRNSIGCMEGISVKERWRC